MKFEWDSEKERINIGKHGITFEQAAYVFSDPFALTVFDEDIQVMKIDGFCWEKP